MNWLENLLIVAGISLDIFAGMECQGSLVKKINKKHLFAICTVVAIGQLIELFLGYFLSDLFCRKYAVANEKMLGEIIAMLIFFAVGIRLMTKAVRNERIRLPNAICIFSMLKTSTIKYKSIRDIRQRIISNIMLHLPVSDKNYIYIFRATWSLFLKNFF